MTVVWTVGAQVSRAHEEHGGEEVKGRRPRTRTGVKELEMNSTSAIEKDS